MATSWMIFISVFLGFCIILRGQRLFISKEITKNDCFQTPYFTAMQKEDDDLQEMKERIRRMEQKHGECPVGWYKHLRKCYHIETRIKLTWNDASGQCRVWNSELALPVNTAENEYLKYLVRATGEGQIFLRLTDNENENQWIDPLTRQSVVYTDWAPGQPDNNDRGEHCAGPREEEQYKWNDVPCDRLYGFICESQIMN